MGNATSAGSRIQPSSITAAPHMLQEQHTHACPWPQTTFQLSERQLRGGLHCHRLRNQLCLQAKRSPALRLLCSEGGFHYRQPPGAGDRSISAAWLKIGDASFFAFGLLNESTACWLKTHEQLSADFPPQPFPAAPSSSDLQFSAPSFMPSLSIPAMPPQPLAMFPCFPSCLLSLQAPLLPYQDCETVICSTAALLPCLSVVMAGRKIRVGVV